MQNTYGAMPTNSYLKKFAKKIMIQQDSRAVALEREIEKLLYDREKLSRNQLRRIQSRPSGQSLIGGKMKAYANEYPVGDLLAKKDKELVKTELLLEQLRLDRDYLAGKLRGPVDISDCDLEELESEFQDQGVVQEYIGANTKQFIKQRRELKHTKYCLGNDFEEVEEKLNNLNQEWKFVKGKKKRKPFLLEYNTFEDVEEAFTKQSKEVLKLVKQVQSANDAIKRRIANLESM